MHKMKIPKTKSIYCRFLNLLAMAFLASALFFLLLHQGGSALLESYFEKTDYMERENERRIADFREYVEKNQLSTTHTSDLTQWVQRQSVVWMQIYRDHVLLYDSQFPYMGASPEYHVKGQYYEWEAYRMVHFEDGDAQVFLTGMYTYQFFNYALLIELFLSVLLFTGIIMAGIRSTMKYIRTLSAEIEILEGGNLDYRITVMGNDEMAVLAKGLDSMRSSIREKISQEAELIHLSQSMITSLSHDLRTPLTALLIYTEILKNEVDASRENMLKWVYKIDEKALQIKDMADCIFNYSLQKKKTDPVSLERMTFHTAFYDALSDACVCLRQQGFDVSFSAAPDDKESGVEIRVDQKYINRILDNICSNLVKYASHESPVRINCFHEEAYCGILFENIKQKDISQVESNGIGVPNIREMMEAMGGTCESEESGEIYRLRLTFAICDMA